MTPWMHPVEVSQFLAAAESTAPKRCLEWGAGGSTVLLLTLPTVEEVVSIEHNRSWYETVLKDVCDPRLKSHYVPADKPGMDERPGSVWAELAEHNPSLLRSYVAAPDGVFDFILVDGRARRFCLLKGYTLLKSGGVMVLHDAQRAMYHDVLKPLEASFLQPWFQGQIAIVRKP